MTRSQYLRIPLLAAFSLALSLTLLAVEPSGAAATNLQAGTSAAAQPGNGST